jgi:hypothetical protein
MDKLPVGDVWLGNSEHVDGSLVESDENTVVDLSQAEQFQAFADFRVDSVDTVIKMGEKTVNVEF